MQQQAETDNRPWVLVVDDSRVVRKTILKILGQDFNIIEAEDGMAGWRMASQNSRIEAIISDIQMPELDGYNLICKIRAAEDIAMRDLPIIVITSAEDEITRERAYACGANDFILKPFNAGQLTECVRAQLNERRTAEPELTSPEAHKAPEPRKAEIESVIVSDTPVGTVQSALDDIDAGLNTLRGLDPSTITPHALTLSLRFLPLLKYCNARFKLGLDKEIAVFQERISAAHKNRGASKPNGG